MHVLLTKALGRMYKGWVKRNEPSEAFPCFFKTSWKPELFRYQETSMTDRRSVPGINKEYFTMESLILAQDER